jgi:diguanylate cyclase (GGDEF)-like protein
MPMHGAAMRIGTDLSIRVTLDDEAGRLAALARYEIIDTAAEHEFEQIVQLVQQVFETPMAAVTLIDADRQWFKARRGIGAAQTPRSQAFCHYTIADADGLAVEDAEADPRFADSPLVTGDRHIRSYLGAPLRTPDGYQIGALCVISDKVRRFSATNREILRRFSQVVVSQMELRQLASLDSLTGLLTRWAFDQAVFDALAGPRRPAAIALFDIDHFKQINDQHGHCQGDTVLAAIAEVLRDALPPGAAIGRLGGEEFGVLLPGHDLDAAVTVAEHMRAAIAAVRMPGLPVATVSAGMAMLAPAMATASDWLQAADAALYAAKAQGRDRLVLA